MRRGVIVAAAAACVLSLLVPTPAIAAKPSSTCTKKGRTVVQGERKYTCVISKGRLTWNKGVRVSPKTPVSSTKPSAPAVPALASGLLEQSYTGYFADQLNFFDTGAISSQRVTRVDFRQGHDGKYQFSRRWTGYFIPSSSGEWKFDITSDDASYFWLGAGAVNTPNIQTALIAIPGVHAPVSKSASVTLIAGRAYPVRTFYGNDINFAQMTLTVTSPGGVTTSDLTAYFKYSIPATTAADGIRPTDPAISGSSAQYPISLDIWKDVPRDSVATAIQSILNAALLRPETFTGQVEWAFQDSTTAEVAAKTQHSLYTAMDLYTKLGFQTTNTLAINARDMDWLRAQLTLRGCKYGQLSGNPGFYLPRSCPDGNGAVTAQHWAVLQDQDPFGIDGVGFNTTLPHEYFHQLQEQLSAGLGNGPYPLWFWEGGAVFFSMLAYASWNPDRYYDQWHDLIFAPGELCQTVNVLPLRNDETGPERPCGYWKGSLVVEYFVAKYGVEKYRRLIDDVAQSPAHSFNASFERVTTTSFDSFAADVHAFLVQRGWEK